MMGSDNYESGNPNTSSPGIPPMGIGARTLVENAIIDKNARIGKDCVLTPKGMPENYDGDHYYIRDGIIIVPKGGVIPDGTRD